MRRRSPPAAAAAERGWLKDTSIPYLVAGAFVLALISVLLIDWVPSSDPWAWLGWGQEITSSHISLSLSGGPSWKPFPVVFTTVFALFGHAAPDMWLVVTRTAGLLAIIAMFRLGRRFGGIVAGVVAVIALCFVQDALFYFARGASEPVVAATTLWAIDRHLAGSPRIAYVLLFLATMNRPEFSAFLGLYAIYLWLRVPGSRPLVATGIILVPIAWLLGPYIISGNAFQAGSAALGGTGSPGGAIPELRSSAGLMSVPTLVLAAVGLGFAYVRRESRAPVARGRRRAVGGDGGADDPGRVRAAPIPAAGGHGRVRARRGRGRTDRRVRRRASSRARGSRAYR